MFHHLLLSHLLNQLFFRSSVDIVYVNALDRLFTDVQTVSLSKIIGMCHRTWWRWDLALLWYCKLVLLEFSVMLIEEIFERELAVYSCWGLNKLS